MSPIVYCISEGRADDGNIGRTGPELIARVKNAAACGVTHFQIREKRLSAARLFDLASEAAVCARETGVKLLINGRFDIAVASGSDGVHLPADGLPAAEVRKATPAGLLIAVSTHNAKEAVRARDEGADLLVFGPVFSSPGKGDGVGTLALAAVCRELRPFPVVALGGVDESSIAAVLDAGAAGFAAIRYLNGCIDTGRRALPRG